jgi:hypothetical protein
MRLDRESLSEDLGEAGVAKGGRVCVECMSWEATVNQTFVS